MSEMTEEQTKAMNSVQKMLATLTAILQAMRDMRTGLDLVIAHQMDPSSTTTQALRVFLSKRSKSWTKKRALSTV